MEGISRSLIYCSQRLYTLPLCVGLVVFLLFFPPFHGKADEHLGAGYFWARLVMVMLVAYALLVLIFGCSAHCRRALRNQSVRGRRLGAA
jgi:threonine/homoserine/homoserine lactone efflux protein